MHPSGGFEELGGGERHGRRGRVDLGQFMLDYLVQDAGVEGAVVPRADVVASGGFAGRPEVSPSRGCDAWEHVGWGWPFHAGVWTECWFQSYDAGEETRVPRGWEEDTAYAERLAYADDGRWHLGLEVVDHVEGVAGIVEPGDFVADVVLVEEVRFAVVGSVGGPDATNADGRVIESA